MGNESTRKTVDTGLRPPPKKDKPATKPTTKASAEPTSVPVVQPTQ
jgi:hypothetical protein